MLKKTKQLVVNLLSKLFAAAKTLRPAVLWVGLRVKKVSERPAARRVFRFTNRYSTQIGFAFLTLVFLMVNVGEGQAYEIPTSRLAALSSSQDGSFIGKPQLYIGQTLSTGEVQQLLAINYTVEKGDSISSIASRYNLSVGTIVDVNGLKTSQIEKIQPGTQLLIPAQETDTSLAWLDDLNSMKEAERQKAIAAQQQQKARLASRYTVRLAKNIGDIVVLRKYRVGELGSNGAVGGQCTYWVKYNRPDLPASMGNAGNYIERNRSKNNIGPRHNTALYYGFDIGNTPVVGSVMVTDESSVGHVAMVTGVTSSTVTISEMNYVAPYVVNQRTISRNDGAIVGYVYWK